MSKVKFGTNYDFTQINEWNTWGLFFTSVCLHNHSVTELSFARKVEEEKTFFKTQLSSSIHCIAKTQIMTGAYRERAELAFYALWAKLD